MFGLSGVQIVLNSKLQSNWIQTGRTAIDSYKVRRIQFDGRTISKVSMLVGTSGQLQGLRVTDDQGQTFIDEVWYKGAFQHVGEWQTQVVPPGMEIIGIRANTKRWFNYIAKLSFLLWKPPLTEHRAV